MSKLKQEEWHKYDFEVNKYYWIHKPASEEIEIRLSNLIIVSKILDSLKIDYWLFGETLRDLYLHGELNKTNDDDIGIDYGSLAKLKLDALPLLQEEGFLVIRENENMISILKDDRYIDICLFKKKDNKYGYANKFFYIRYFVEFRKLEFGGYFLSIPVESKQIIKKMYNISLVKLTKFLRPINYYRLIKSRLFYFALYLWPKLPFVSNQLLKLFNKKIVKLDYTDFLDLEIEPKESFNWRWRKTHLDIVTNYGEVSKIKDVINYLSVNFNNIEKKIIQTDTSKVFNEPHNYDHRFWQTGNNYFFYCVKFSFKKNVIPYSDANDYIKANGYPYIYTSDYYNALDDMDESSIIKLLRNQPIEVESGCITSGKHRAFAMIGRLIRNNSYIPFFALMNIE